MKKKKWLVRGLCVIVGVPILAIVLLLGVGLYGNHKLSEKAIAITQEMPAPMVESTKEYVWREDVFNILCIGVDREEDMAWRYDDGSGMGQADAIFVVSIDMTSDEIRIIAVPRDTMVELHMFGVYGNYIGAMDGQIALQYAYGDGGWRSCSQVEHRVSEVLCGVPMHGYVAVNLSSIPEINDAVGGVEVTMDADYTWINPEFTQGSTVRLFGSNARDFIQRRDTDIYGSALTRISRSKLYLKAFINQAKSAVVKDIHLPARLLEELSAHMVTSFSEEEVTYLAMEALTCEFSEEQMYVLPGEIKMGEVYEEYYIDEAAVSELVIELFCEEKSE